MKSTFILLLVSLSLKINFQLEAFIDISDNDNSDITTGLVAYYPFNGNDLDESGNFHNPSTNNASLTEDRFGMPNSAYFFNGVNSEIRIPNPFGNNINSSAPVAISLWIKTEMTSFAGYLVNYYTCCTYNDDYFYFVLNNGNQLSYSNGEGLTQTTHPQINNNEWHHIVASFDGIHIKIYLNGKLIIDDAQPSNGHPVNTNYDLVFGNCSINQCDVSTYFEGSMDDIRIYSRPLSCENIIELYSENYNDIVINGAIAVDTSINIGKDIILDGVDVLSPNHLKIYTNQADFINQNIVEHGAQITIKPTCPIE